MGEGVWGVGDGGCYLYIIPNRTQASWVLSFHKSFKFQYQVCADRSMTREITTIFAFATFLLVSSESELSHGKQVDAYLEQMKAKGIWPPPFRSFHIHCLFIAYDAEQLKKAEALKQRFIKQFKLEDTKPCTGLFDQGRLCMYGE